MEQKHQKRQNIEGAMPDPLLSISCTGIVYIKVLFVCWLVWVVGWYLLLYLLPPRAYQPIDIYS